MTDALGKRHLSRSGLHEYLHAHVPAILRIGDTPVAHLVIDPPAGTIAVRFRQLDSALPDIAACSSTVSASTMRCSTRSTPTAICSPVSGG